MWHHVSQDLSDATRSYTILQISCLGITKLQGSDNPLKFKLTVIELTEIKEALHQEKTLIKKLFSSQNADKHDSSTTWYQD